MAERVRRVWLTSRQTGMRFSAVVCTEHTNGAGPVVLVTDGCAGYIPDLETGICTQTADPRLQASLSRSGLRRLRKSVEEPANG